MNLDFVTQNKYISNIKANPIAETILNEPLDEFLNYAHDPTEWENHKIQGNYELMKRIGEVD